MERTLCEAQRRAHADEGAVDVSIGLVLAKVRRSEAPTQLEVPGVEPLETK
jgi:hypothetical protein